jgi:hypothetical protein
LIAATRRKKEVQGAPCHHDTNMRRPKGELCRGSLRGDRWQPQPLFASALSAEMLHVLVLGVPAGAGSALHGLSVKRRFHGDAVRKLHPLSTAHGDAESVIN